MQLVLLLRRLSHKHGHSHDLQFSKLRELEDSLPSSAHDMAVSKKQSPKKQAKAKAAVATRSCRKHGRYHFLWPGPAASGEMVGSTERQVPRGHVPVSVEGLAKAQTYLIKAKHLSHPFFLNLLDLTAQEYGYSHQGILKVVCDLALFEKALASLS